MAWNDVAGNRHPREGRGWQRPRVRLNFAEHHHYVRAALTRGGKAQAAACPAIWGIVFGFRPLSVPENGIAERTERGDKFRIGLIGTALDKQNAGTTHRKRAPAVRGRSNRSLASVAIINTGQRMQVEIAAVTSAIRIG